MPLIERDLLQAWWINHAYLDGFGSAIMEYSSKDRSDPRATSTSGTGGCATTGTAPTS